MVKADSPDENIVSLAKAKPLLGNKVADIGELAALSTRLMLDFEPHRVEAQV